VGYCCCDRRLDAQGSTEANAEFKLIFNSQHRKPADGVKYSLEAITVRASSAHTDAIKRHLLEHDGSHVGFGASDAGSVRIGYVPGNVRIGYVPGNVRIGYVPGNVRIGYVPGNVRTGSKGKSLKPRKVKQRGHDLRPLML
jgi:hypothetical protein